MTAVFARMAAEVQLTDEQIEGFRALGKRAERAMEPVAQRAHAEGRLGPGVGAADLLLGVRMLSGLCKPFKRPEHLDQDLDAGLALLMRGLGPRWGLTKRAPLIRPDHSRQPSPSALFTAM
jgi:hypothetical protein